MSVKIHPATDDPQRRPGYRASVAASPARPSGPKPPLAHRLGRQGWIALDAIAALLALSLVIRHPLGWSGAIDSRVHPLRAVFVAAAIAPVALRRIWPLAALAISGTATIVVTVTGHAPFPIAIMLTLAVYTVASSFSRRLTVPVLAVVSAALTSAALAAGVGTNAWHTVVLAVSAWFVGDSTQARRRYEDGLARQAAERRRIERERDRQSIQQERVRIARELHDVVAHSLSVITVQAGVARRVIATRPDEAKPALEAIESLGRSALDELRRMLGLLRDDETEPALLTPSPGIDDLPALVDQVRAAGVPVELLIDEPLGSPPATIGLTVYRIVQEALTNVVKHAGPVRTRVAISHQNGGINVEVTDEGPQRTTTSNGHHPDHTAPHGLVGMRERVSAYGGSLVAEPQPGGGFHVDAFLPYPNRSP